MTGATAVGSLLAKHGFRTATLFQLTAEMPNEYDALVVSSESRTASARNAARAAGEWARSLSKLQPRLLAKRIDSTLRGNLGAETDAILDALGSHAIGIVVPAYPAGGRTTSGGRHHVLGIPLDQTEVSSDLTWPMKESDVSNLFQKQSSHRVVYRPPRTEWPADARIIVCDATNDNDLQELAAEVGNAPFVAVPIDPGPFTALLALEVCGEKKRSLDKQPIEKGTILVVAGSRTPVSQAQLASLKLIQFDPSVDSEARIIAQVHMSSGLVTGIEAKGSLIAGGQHDVAQSLGKVTKLLLEEGQFTALYTTGGHVTREVCEALNADGIDLLDEIIPLVSYGKILGGPFNGLPIVTKGGFVGPQDAAVTSIRYLQQKMK